MSDAKSPNREQRTKGLSTIKVCPKCGAFMSMRNEFRTEGEKRHFAADHQLRSFGGVEIRTFVCDKCEYVGSFQVDPFPKDDSPM